MTNPVRRRQWLLSGWLVLTGCTVAMMLGYSMWWRLQGQFQVARDWLGWAVLVMLLSVYVSDAIRGVRRVPDDGSQCCSCCRRDIRLPPKPEPGDPPNMTKF